MASISLSTTHKMKIKPKTTKTTKTKKRSTTTTTSNGKKGGTLSFTPALRRGSAPKLIPKNKTEDIAIASLSKEEQKVVVKNGLLNVFGEDSIFHGNKIDKPHKASTSSDRMAAAADLAIITKNLGVVKVFKEMGVLLSLERVLVTENCTISWLVDNNKQDMKRVTSTASLASMNSAGSYGLSTNMSVNDAKKGKTSAVNAREGSLFYIRALCDVVGRSAEPFVVPLLAAVLDETWSSNSSIREAAEDTCSAIISLASPLAAPAVIIPVLAQAIQLSTEWRVKENAMNCITQLSSKDKASREVCRHLQSLIPVLVSQVWDTKAQVVHAAQNCLFATCSTISNPDVKPSLPELITAMVKPSETLNAIDKLLGTTFVAPVDAPTLAILCPILSRALKEKMAIHKRSACIILENMSRLVDAPQSLQPFGHLLVPELNKVIANMQFEDIRDVALSAMHTLTKALGNYNPTDDPSDKCLTNMSFKFSQTANEIENIQDQISQERADEEAKDLERETAELEERRLWKEAMDAQRQLNQIAEKEEEEKKEKEMLEKVKQKQSTKNTSGKCAGCGFKKCRKPCLFYGK